MSQSLFVGNIPYGAMEKELKEHFEAVVPVEDVHFVMDWRKGRFRGFGFVRLAEEDLEKARTELDEKPFQGRRLKISMARNRAPEGKAAAFS